MRIILLAFVVVGILLSLSVIALADPPQAPDNKERYIGVWEGTWDSIRPVIITIKSINPDGKVSAIYEWGTAGAARSTWFDTTVDKAGKRNVSGEYRNDMIELAWSGRVVTITATGNSKTAMATYMSSARQRTSTATLWKK